MIKDVAKPVCPKHFMDMRYEPSISRWKCPEFGCKATSQHHVTDDAEDIPVTKKALADPKALVPVYDGTMKLRIGMDNEGADEYTIVVTGDDGSEHILVVTDYVETVIDDQTNSVTLCLLFHDVERA